jgi:hypothetical protein
MLFLASAAFIACKQDCECNVVYMHTVAQVPDGAPGPQRLPGSVQGQPRKAGTAPGV